MFAEDAINIRDLSLFWSATDPGVATELADPRSTMARHDMIIRNRSRVNQCFYLACLAIQMGWLKENHDSGRVDCCSWSFRQLHVVRRVCCCVLGSKLTDASEGSCLEECPLLHTCKTRYNGIRCVQVAVQILLMS